METTSRQSANKSLSHPALLLKLEGLAVAVFSVVAFAMLGGNWVLFAVLWLAPDLAFVVYALSKQAGLTTYNVVHHYAWPVLLTGIALAAAWPLGVQLALIWTSHIAIDRLFGYGFKYTADSKDTHLQRV